MLDFFNRVLDNRTFGEPQPPLPPKADDITKRVKVEVPDFDGQWNPSFFYDWLIALEDYFAWYKIEDA